MKNTKENNSIKPRFNSFKLLFTWMTAYFIAFFTVYSTVNLPYSQKSTECIVNTLSSNFDSIWTWTISRINDLSIIKSPQLLKKINLCNIYEARWTDLWDGIYGIKFTWLAKNIIMFYFTLWGLIFLGVFLNDFLSWLPFLNNLCQPKNKNRK